MGASQPDLSIIIPAFREAKRIGKTLDTLAKFLATKDYGQVEVLVVVARELAGESDDTFEIARSKTKQFESGRVIDAGPRSGKGRDVRVGMREAKGRYKLFMDADLATPLHHLDTVHHYMGEEADVIICVRNLQATHTGLRKFISSFGNLLVRAVLGLDIKDTQCGFKAFRAPVDEDLFGKQTINGWGFDMEILAIAASRGYTIRQIPAHDWQDVAGGTFGNVAVTGALSTFTDMLKIKFNLLRGKYKPGR